MARLCLQQVRLLDPASDRDQVVDVLIENGVIQAIAPHLSDLAADTPLASCAGLILGPGLVDLYSASGEPGFEERETLQSLAAAAVAGGFTRLNLLPNTDPPIDGWAMVDGLSAKWRQGRTVTPPQGLPHLQCWGALTIAAQGQQMSELLELSAMPIAGFTDGQPIANLVLVRRLLEYLQPLGKPVMLWAYDRALAGSGVMRSGVNALRFGLPDIPVMAETAPLGALLECVAEVGTPVHLMRISTARGVALIREAKARGVPITASTTWIHLILDTHALGSYDPALRLEPSLGNSEDRQALVEAVREGVIDAIAVDHQPYAYEEKTVTFAEAPAGTIGLELSLPLLWQSLVATGEWSALDLWSRLSWHPAACLAQQLTEIVPHQPAELTLFDPNQPWIVEERTLQSRSGNTFWLGKSIMGKVQQTWCPESVP